MDLNCLQFSTLLQSGTIRVYWINKTVNSEIFMRDYFCENKIHGKSLSFTDIGSPKFLALKICLLRLLLTKISRFTVHNKISSIIRVNT